MPQPIPYNPDVIATGIREAVPALSDAQAEELTGVVASLLRNITITPLPRGVPEVTGGFILSVTGSDDDQALALYFDAQLRPRLKVFHPGDGNFAEPLWERRAWHNAYSVEAIGEDYVRSALSDIIRRCPITGITGSLPTLPAAAYSEEVAGNTVRVDHLHLVEGAISPYISLALMLAAADVCEKLDQMGCSAIVSDYVAGQTAGNPWWLLGRCQFLSDIARPGHTQEMRVFRLEQFVRETRLHHWVQAGILTTQQAMTIRSDTGLSGIRPIFPAAGDRILKAVDAAVSAVSRSSKFTAHFPVDVIALCLTRPPAALSSYPPQYLSWQTSEEALEGLKSITALYRNLADFGANGVVERPGRQSTQVPVRPLLAEGLTVEEAMARAETLEDMRSLCSLYTYEAVGALFHRFKNAFRTPDGSHTQLSEAADLRDTLLRTVLYPTLDMMGIAGRAEMAVIANVFIADVLRRLRADEFVRSVKAFHGSSNLSDLIRLAGHEGETWSALADPVTTNCDATGQAFTFTFLTTPGDLARTGQSQNHCVGTYVPNCLFEDTHIAIITDETGEVRATVEVKMEETGECYIRQIKGPRNQDVDANLDSLARRWLHEIANSPEFEPSRLLAETRSRLSSQTQRDLVSARAGYTVTPESVARVYSVFRRMCPAVLPGKDVGEFIGYLRQHPVISRVVSGEFKAPGSDLRSHRAP